MSDKLRKMTTSKNLKTALFASLIAAIILPFSAMGVAEAMQANEKTSVKNLIETRMQEQVRKDQDETTQYTSDEYGIPYNLVFEDNNGKLVVGIDVEKAREFNEDYTVAEVKSDLQTNQDVEVNYYGFVRETGPTNTKVFGGSEIKKVTGSNSWTSATITLIQNNKIITTGHLSDTGGSVYMNCGGINICLGTVGNNPNSTRQHADAAIVTTAINLLNLQENKIKYGSTTYSVTDGVSSDIVKYGAVKMAGVTTPNSSGIILDTDVRAKFVDLNGVSWVMLNQVLANYPSDKGDSGAPVFITTGSSTAKIIGQHVGKYCLIDLYSGHNYGQWCSDPKTAKGAIPVFSSWPYVKTNLGI